MNPSVLIVGGGAVGLSIGWELARRGANPTVFERDTVGAGASRAAAGMLAPDAELEFEERELHALNRESKDRWPAFADRLEAETGADLGLRSHGTLIVADDRDSAEALRRRYRFQKENGLDVEWLTGEEARTKEPFLAPDLSAAVWSPGDHEVDNRALIDALADALRQNGGRIREETPVAAIEPHDDRPAVVTADGERVEGDRVVLAAGAAAQQVDGLNGASPPVRPVKGQILGLEAELPFDLKHVVRGPDAYVVPKADGRVMVGATAEERGFDPAVTGEGLFRNLEGGWEVVPGILDLEVQCTCVGFRPASRDNAPILGPSSAPGVTMAAGHYRHGILLTPVTAEEIARTILDGSVSRWLEPFLPDRFH
jgi:glycine oxidase